MTGTCREYTFSFFASCELLKPVTIFQWSKPHQLYNCYGQYHYKQVRVRQRIRVSFLYKLSKCETKSSFEEQEVMTCFRQSLINILLVGEGSSS